MLVEYGAEPVIPPHKNRKIQDNYDRVIHKQRNVVDPMSDRFNDWRGIPTRFDRNIKIFTGAVSRAAAASR